VIIGGWVPERSRAASIGSLLVGVPTETGLRYVGQVGTGFTDEARRELLLRLVELVGPESPFAGGGPSQRGHWVAPPLFGEVSFRQWTAHGRLAYPTWRGLRPAKHLAAVQAPVMLSGARCGGPEREDQRLLAELDRAVAQVRAELRTLRDQISPHFLHN